MSNRHTSDRRTKGLREAKRSRGQLPVPAVDASEIPPLDAAFFASAVRNPFFRPVKQSTTVRLDADVLAWLRAKGPGYQTRLNAILREAMIKDVAKPAPR